MQGRGVVGGGAEDGDGDIPAHFADREMIWAAYPLLYGRDVSAAELEAGLAFLAERRVSAPTADVDVEEGRAQQVDSLRDGSRQEASTQNRPDDLAARRASMQAWIQYARALFGAAEFRFIE